MRTGLAMLVGAVFLAGCSSGTPQPTATRTVTETVTVVATEVVTEVVTEPAETVTVVATEYVTVEPQPVDRSGAYQTVRDLFQDHLNRQPSLDELQWGVEYVTANGEAQWVAVFADEYAGEADLVRDRESAEQARESIQGGVDTMVCMTNPDDPRCDD